MRIFLSADKSVSCSFVSDSLQLHGLQPTRLLCPWDSSRKNTGVGCHSLLQGTFLTQGVNLGLLHCRWIIYHLSHQESLSAGNKLPIQADLNCKEMYGSWNSNQRWGGFWGWLRPLAPMSIQFHIAASF